MKKKNEGDNTRLDKQFAFNNNNNKQQQMIVDMGIR